jgi:hypothetical protein
MVLASWVVKRSGGLQVKVDGAEIDPRDQIRARKGYQGHTFFHLLL